MSKNKNNIMGFPVEYKVIPEHKVVIATMKGTYRAALSIFDQKYIKPVTNTFYIEDAWISRNKNKLVMPNTFKAVAHCHDDDVFDEEIGREIAYNKLADKFCSSLYKRMNQMAGFFSTIATNYYCDMLDRKGEF